MKLVFHKKSATEGLDGTCGATSTASPVKDFLSYVRQQTESIIQMCQAFGRDNPADEDLALRMELRYTKELGFVRQLEDTTLTPNQRTALLTGAAQADVATNCSDCQAPEDDEAKIISLVLGGANESLSDGTTQKGQVLYWLSQDPDATNNFLSYFSDRGAYLNDKGEIVADEVSESELEGWIYDQEDLADMYEAEFGDQGEEWMVLAKEDEDPDSEEGFLEYRYVDELQAKGSFFNLKNPAALLRREGMTWEIVTMNPAAARLIDMLEEQVELLNA